MTSNGIHYQNEFLEHLYRQMLRIRVCEESFVQPILDKEILCPVHLCTGQEAVAVGVCSALEKDDYIFGSHRSHGHYLAKGGSLQELVAEVYCRSSGCSRGRGGSMHLIAPEHGVLGVAPIVGGTISLALGAALASNVRKDSRVTVSFFGDGATGEGVLTEAINFAALQKLPIVFACENNLYSTHLPINECRPTDDIYQMGWPYGIYSCKVDGNDVLKSYEASKKAVDLCRSGQGPVFLEFKTYRLRGHVGPDDNIQGAHTDIRPDFEVKKWKRKDPLVRFERLLRQNSVLTEDQLSNLHVEIETEVREAHLSARNSPSPMKEELNTYVFK